MTHDKVAWRVVVIQLATQGDLESGTGCIGGSYDNATVTPDGAGGDYAVVERGPGFVKINSTATTKTDERLVDREVRDYRLTVVVTNATAACFVKGSL